MKHESEKAEPNDFKFLMIRLNQEQLFKRIVTRKLFVEKKSLNK